MYEQAPGEQGIDPNEEVDKLETLIGRLTEQLELIEDDESEEAVRLQGEIDELRREQEALFRIIDGQIDEAPLNLARQYAKEAIAKAPHLTRFDVRYKVPGAVEADGHELDGLESSSR